MGKKKKRFEVEEGVSIDEVLVQMKEEGYRPVRRVEEPIFQEMKENGEKKMEPVARKIIFDAVKSE
ncbi:NETI motif-containing protein [Pontibacillus salicampi]|uniref:NETI motif-containing protein n=1 Tax=Pontibacillus salicampi TaxID=1449801 RepID=A0ABV6LMT0_9BACI